jgi:hypothetical protein
MIRGSHHDHALSILRVLSLVVFTLPMVLSIVMHAMVGVHWQVQVLDFVEIRTADAGQPPNYCLAW